MLLEARWYCEKCIRKALCVIPLIDSVQEDSACSCTWQFVLLVTSVTGLCTKGELLVVVQVALLSMNYQLRVIWLLVSFWMFYWIYGVLIPPLDGKKWYDRLVFRDVWKGVFAFWDSCSERCQCDWE